MKHYIVQWNNNTYQHICGRNLKEAYYYGGIGASATRGIVRVTEVSSIPNELKKIVDQDGNTYSRNSFVGKLINEQVDLNNAPVGYVTSFQNVVMGVTYFIMARVNEFHIDIEVAGA